jgi:hypothetical protein
VLNFLGLIVIGVLLSVINYEETLTINQNLNQAILRRRITILESAVSDYSQECSLDDIDVFTENAEGSTITSFTIVFRRTNCKIKKLKLPINKSIPSERHIYDTLNFLIAQAKVKPTSQRSFPASTAPNKPSGRKSDVYAPNITITDDELTYKNTLITAKDYWGIYWIITRSISFVAIGISLLLFVVFPMLRTLRELYLIYIPVSLVSLGLVFSGVYTILFKLIGAKVSETVCFNKMSRVVTIEDRYLTSKSRHKYLFEQVELKLERLQVDLNGYMELFHLVVLNFHISGENQRKLQLLRTEQRQQAVSLYNSIAELLDRPLIGNA